MKFEFREVKHAPMAQKWFFAGTTPKGYKIYFTTNGTKYATKDGKWFKVVKTN